MRKKNIFLLSVILVIAIVVPAFFLTTEKGATEKYQTFAQAAGIQPDSYLVFNNLSIYSEEHDKMVEITLSNEDKAKLSELITNTRVSADKVEYPLTRIIFTDQKLSDTQGNNFYYGTFIDETDEHYVFFHHFNDETSWYKIIDIEIDQFYSELLEKTPQ